MPKLAAARSKAAQKMGPAGETKAAELHHVPVVHPRVNDDDMVILAVDPGENHVGVAVGCRYFTDMGDGVWKLSAPGWRVYEVAELTPWEFVRFFRDNLHLFDIVSCEKFTLYPHLAKEQVGSEMPTSKLIGWIEFTLRLWNECFTKEHTAAHGREEIQYVSYPANIHAGTTSVMKKREIPFVSPATPDHARSAELHLWCTLIRSGLVPGVELA